MRKKKGETKGERKKRTKKQKVEVIFEQTFSNLLFYLYLGNFLTSIL